MDALAAIPAAQMPIHALRAGATVIGRPNAVGNLSVVTETALETALMRKMTVAPLKVSRSLMIDDTGLQNVALSYSD